MTLENRVNRQDTAGGVPQQDLATRVLRGAAWLDEIRPGWAGEIDTEALDMRLPDTCVLGQLFADKVTRYIPSGYYYAVQSLCDDNETVVAARGFLFTPEEWRNPGWGGELHNKLFGEQRELWLKAIEERRTTTA